MGRHSSRLLRRETHRDARRNPHGRARNRPAQRVRPTRTARLLGIRNARPNRRRSTRIVHASSRLDKVLNTADVARLVHRVALLYPRVVRKQLHGQPTRPVAAAPPGVSAGMKIGWSTIDASSSSPSVRIAATTTAILLDQPYCESPSDCIRAPAAQWQSSVSHRR